MRHRALMGGADALGVFPQSAGGKVSFARVPVCFARGQNIRLDHQVNRAGVCVNANGVAVFNQRNRPALGSL